MGGGGLGRAPAPTGDTGRDRPRWQDAPACRGKKHGVPATHLLSAFSHQLGVTLGQVPVGERTNENPMAPEVISQVVITGRVLTMDAVLTQRAIAQTIVDQGGEYVMVVKENQPQLQRDIATMFASPSPQPMSRGGRRRPPTTATAGPSGGASR